MHSVSLSSSLSFAKSQINQSNFINVVARSRNYPSSLSLFSSFERLVPGADDERFLVQRTQKRSILALKVKSWHRIGLQQDTYI